WENERNSLYEQRAQRLRKRDQAMEACAELGWMLGEAPQGFAELLGKARAEIERLESGKGASTDELLKVGGKKQEAESAFIKIRSEISALERQPSNIPARMIEMRGKIAAAIGIAEGALPFVGELIEVKQGEAAWQGAIERVLHGFALSILTDEQNYAALSRYVNDAHLGQRLVYYRIGRAEQRHANTVGAHSLAMKLNIKDGACADWLKAELNRRFDYACVDSIQAFRAEDRALTREGQVKHGKHHHEKDDRREIGDRRNWVLGFDNREKLELLRQDARELAAIISDCNGRIKLIQENDNQSARRARHCQTLVNLQWQEIDVASLVERIANIEKTIHEMSEGNTALKDLTARIAEQDAIASRARNDLREINDEYRYKLSQIKRANEMLENLRADPSIVPLTPHQNAGLSERYGREGSHNLETLEQTSRSVRATLNKEILETERGIANCEKNIESVLADFKRSWPMDSGDLDASLQSAPDYFVKLTRLETDGLPAHEERFFDLLQSQSNQNLAALSARLNDARKAIMRKMELVNDSLSQVPFNRTEDQCTYLRIQANDRQGSDVKEFRQDILKALRHSLNGDEREDAENRFRALRALVERLSGQDSAQKAWREAVLDVRQHVEFVGHEIDENGKDIEIYRSGAGKSGGQRQKLATTCLAAALRYQLGGNDRDVPMYAPVVLDEAFDKADNEFTALSMNIFNNFGFQMIVATPLRSVMTLEPFIGGACFVDIRDRRDSSVLLIEYDNEGQRLNLPNQFSDTDSED
ncbi:MAG: hypothetical protein FWE09_05065, partial [Treponema sp.]|nr:hypothetical protein [Treponema sp.]